MVGMPGGFSAREFNPNDSFSGSLRNVALPEANRDQAEIANDAVALESVSSAVEFAALIPDVCRGFEQSRRNRLPTEISFKEYLTQVWNDPHRTVRSVAQYQVDAFEHYGFEEKVIGGREIKDFAARTFPWQSSALDHRRELVGQEVGTFAYYQFCQRAAQDERSRAILCVHGHSGSGKTTFFQMRDEMLEDFSRNHPEGALYRLVWRFSEVESQRFGFAIDPNAPAREEKKRGEVRIPADNNTDPIFVIPSERLADGGSSPREALLEALKNGGRVDDSFCRDYFLSDGLDPLSRKILDHLLEVYKGDMATILDRHVTVERWSYSNKLAEGLVSLKPNPDHHADIRPIHQPRPMMVRDAALETLPELHSTGALFLRANRGVLHYADMFRPTQQDRAQGDITRFNYLLDTLESGSVQVMSPRDPTALRNVPSFVFVSADTNDHNILEKMQSSGFEQLRERIEFVTFGLITRFKQEERVYELGVSADAKHQPSPHALETLALFACSTRLLSPNTVAPVYEIPGLRDVVKKLTPVGKALLLDEQKGVTAINHVLDDSDELTAEQAKLLSQHTALVANEYAGGLGQTKFWLYDGSLGLSTRAAIGIAARLLADHPDHPVTAMDVCTRLSELVTGGLPYYEDIKRMKQQVAAKVEQEFRAEGVKHSDIDVINKVKNLVPIPEPIEILGEVTEYAKRVIKDDLAEGLGLVTGKEAERALQRYVWHLRSYLTGGSQLVPEEFRIAKMRDNGRASEVVMRDFEDTCLEANRPATDEARDAFRKLVFGRIAAWTLDHPGKRFDQHIGEALPGILQEVSQSGRGAQRKAFSQFLSSATAYGTNDGSLERDMQSSDKEIQGRAQEYFDVVTQMERLGYHRDTVAKEIVWALTEHSLSR